MWFKKQKPKGRVSNFSIGTINSLWKDSNRGSDITVCKKPIISHNSKIFAIGSCFAVEIRNALRTFNYDVYPKYFDIEINSRHSVGKLPKRDNINHYDTFVIRQEIERATNQGRYSKGDFWEIPHRRGKQFGTDFVWQDPYRRDVFAATAKECEIISNRISEIIDKGLRSADIIIITLGLTEVWRNKKSGLFICQGPKSDKDPVNQLIEFKLSTFAENKKNIQTIIEAIQCLGDKKIVITVSPVALGKTFTDQDVVVANMQSKSTLRAVAGEILRENPDVTYWPSYEFAMMQDIFADDGRHVKKEYVQKIVRAFLEATS